MEARRSGMLRAAHPLSSARRRRAPRWATQQPYFGDLVGRPARVGQISSAMTTQNGESERFRVASDRWRGVWVLLCFLASSFLQGT